MRHIILLLVCLLAIIGPAHGQEPSHIRQMRNVPEQFASLPIVRTFEEITAQAGKQVICIGRYKRWDWELPNEEAFQGQAILYLADGRRVLIGSSINGECDRSEAELKQLHGKKVVIVGDVFRSNPATIGYASLNASHIQDIKYIGRR